MSHSYKYVDLLQVNKKSFIFLFIYVFLPQNPDCWAFCRMQKLHKRDLSGVRKHSYNLVHRSPIRQKSHLNIKTVPYHLSILILLAHTQESMLCLKY